MGIGSSNLVRSAAESVWWRGVSATFASFSHATRVSDATTFHHLSRDIVPYQPLHKQVVKDPAKEVTKEMTKETAIVLSRRLEQAPRLDNVWDNSPAPDVEVFHERDDLNRLLGTQAKFKFIAAQHPDRGDDVKIFLCEDVSEGHKTLAAKGQALGYGVVMAGHVCGNPDSPELILTNTSGHYQPRETLPKDFLSSQFRVAELAFEQLGWKALGKSYVWKTPSEHPSKQLQLLGEGKYVPDHQYEVSETAVEIRRGAKSKSDIVNES